jgi:hypothetical protein
VKKIIIHVSNFKISENWKPAATVFEQKSFILSRVSLTFKL